MLEIDKEVEVVTINLALQGILPKWTMTPLLLSSSPEMQQKIIWSNTWYP